MDVNPIPTGISEVDAVLAERGSRYGVFKDHARITQLLKETMRQQPGWRRLSPSQMEALEMVVHKIARILNGDPGYLDSWVDIEGYVRLIVKELQGDPT